MSVLLWLFDGVLVLTLVGVALAALAAADLHRAVVLFIVFGLLMALAWTRLLAVDVALAEAAIGAGLTGALFLNTLHTMGMNAHDPVRRGTPERLVLAALALGVGGIVGAALLALEGVVGLRAAVAAELAHSGASNPVTAVLLNFRAYDTLLEVAVLLMAVVGVWSLAPRGAGRERKLPPGPVLIGFTRLLVPVIVLTAGYLLWSGTSSPGGAFQAGALLCGAGVLLLLSGTARVPARAGWRARAMLGAGFAVFLGVGIGVMATGRRFLEYPPDAASALILLIEASLTISIALVLLALFAGGPAARVREEPR